MHFSRSHSACDELKERFVKNQDNVYSAELENFYMKAYLKYSAKHMIPDKYVNEIFDDIGLFLEIYKKFLISKLKESFSNYNITECGKEIEKKAFFQKFESFLNYFSIYEQVHKNLQTDNSKFKWIESSKHYVEPNCVALPDNDEYHYISIIKSLKSFLNNNYLNREYFQNVPFNESNRIMCFKDSLKFKANPLFRNSPNALQIRFYIDNFNLANPLGDA